MQLVNKLLDLTKNHGEIKGYIESIKLIIEENNKVIVQLTEIGPSRIYLIKELRSLLNWTLAEAKEFTDNVPNNFNPMIQAEANKLTRSINSAGGKWQVIK